MRFHTKYTKPIKEQKNEQYTIEISEKQTRRLDHGRRTLKPKRQIDL